MRIGTHIDASGRFFLTILTCAFLLASSNAFAADNYGSVTNTLSGAWNNYGSVVTSNNNEYGMEAFREPNTNAASGSIITYGDGAHGIINTDNLLQNYGTISTYGTGAHGLYLNSSGFPAELQHSGSVTAYGANSNGIYGFAPGGSVIDIDISGAVAAYGGGYAVHVMNANVHLDSDARIVSGSLYAEGTPHTNSLYLDGSGTVDFDIVGAWTVLNKVQAGAWTFEKSATFNTINFSAGTLSIASGKQLIATDYSQAAGTTLAVALDSAGTIPVDLSGNAAVAGTLVVDASASALTGGRVIIDAAGGAGNFDSVISSNPHITLSASRVGNQIVLNNGAYTPQWDNSALGLASTMSSNLVFLQLPSARSMQLMAGNEEQEPIMVAYAGPMYDLLPKSSDSEDRRYAVYMQPMFSVSTRDAFNGAPGYTATTLGIEVGADTYVNDDLLLGAFAGYASADINVKGVAFSDRDSEEQNLYTMGVYGGYRAGDWIVTDSLSFTYTQNDSSRNAGLGETAKGDYSTQLLTNRFLAAYVMPMGETWELAPEMGLNANYIYRGAFSETGAVNALDYDTYDDFQVESVLGLRLRTSFEHSGIQLTPYARLAWAHDLLGNDFTIRQSLGANTAMITQKNDNDHVDLELGMSIRKGDTMLSLSCNGEGSEHSRSFGLLANLRFEF